MTEVLSNIFLSYCAKDSVIADLTEKCLKNFLGDSVYITRYTRDVEYRGSFKEFMKSVSKHNFVLCIVSDNYLKSYPCLFEVGETLRNYDYESRLLFIVLNDQDKKYYLNQNQKVGADIYSSEGRLNYIKYWENELNQMKRNLDRIESDIATINEMKHLSNVNKIINYDLPEFMDFIADRRGIPFQECMSSNFENIVKAIGENSKNVFEDNLDYRTLLRNAIDMIAEITGTDYNQIIVHGKTKKHGYGLVVVADCIAPHKQRYRIVAIDGLIGKTFDSGQVTNVKDTFNEKEYFCAVPSTKSELIVPICFEGNKVGVINSESDEENHYTPEMILKLENLSRNLAKQLRKLGYNTRVDYNDIPYISL